jgi:hypothetical protein
LLAAGGGTAMLTGKTFLHTTTHYSWIQQNIHPVIQQNLILEYNQTLFLNTTRNYSWIQPDVISEYN